MWRRRKEVSQEFPLQHSVDRRVGAVMMGSQKFSDDKAVYSCVEPFFFPCIEGLAFSWWTRPPFPVWALLSYQMMFLHVYARKSSNVVVCCLFIGWAWVLVKWSCLTNVAIYQGIPPSLVFPWRTSFSNSKFSAEQRREHVHSTFRNVHLPPRMVYFDLGFSSIVASKDSGKMFTQL